MKPAAVPRWYCHLTGTDEFGVFRICTLRHAHGGAFHEQNGVMFKIVHAHTPGDTHDREPHDGGED